MAKGGLKGALDQYRGRNIRLEKQRKKEKAALKRKEQNKKNGVEDVEVEEDVDTTMTEATSETKQPKESKRQKKLQRAAKKAEAKKAAEPAVAQEEPEWETDEDEEDVESEDDITRNLRELEESDSGGSADEDEEEEMSEDDEDEEGEDEDEEDIPFSDIESLASEDKEDVVPHQRLTINNTAALTAGLNRISLPYSKMTFSEHQSITSDEPLDIPDVEDDLARELAFYKQSLSAVKDARAKLKAEGVPFSRPADYFAEMVKSDEHMGKIKAKLVDEAAGKKASAEARRQRDLKKFGKQVQVAKLQERAKEKKNTLEKINLLKRKRSGADVTSTNEEDLFDVALDKESKPDSGRDRDSSKPNFKRMKKDNKYGFGGKKRHAKSNDAKSTNDDRSFSIKKMKGKTGAAKRPGKARRAKA